jgi:hypothetical protein
VASAAENNDDDDDDDEAEDDDDDEDKDDDDDIDESDVVAECVQSSMAHPSTRLSRESSYKVSRLNKESAASGGTSVRLKLLHTKTHHTTRKGLLVHETVARKQS